MVSGALTCASFVDDEGKKRVTHVTEAGSEKNLVMIANNIIRGYPASMGFFSKGLTPESDLMTLHKRSLANSIPSIVNALKTNRDRTKLGPDPIPDKVH